jgi:hypothetical protein
MSLFSQGLNGGSWNAEEKSRAETVPGDLRVVKYPELSNHFVLGFRVFSANMGCKIFIAPPLVVLLHFIERFAGGRPRRVEHPSAFGATPALKTLFFDPCEFALHGLPSTPLNLLRLRPSSATATTKAALFIAMSEVQPKPPVFEHTPNLK